jgi:hypothetical protein
MASYYLEVQKRNSGQWAVYLWRSTWLGGSDIVKSVYRSTKKEIDFEVEIMKANKDKYIKEYEEGLCGHKYIPL